MILHLTRTAAIAGLLALLAPGARAQPITGQVALDASSVVTGGVAVTALAAGHAAKGGVITNPSTATTDLCINQQGAAGTATSGATICIQPGQPMFLTPGPLAVSVNATDASHTFAGYGLK